ncbi:MAG: leucyl aminopeptidase [Acidobacteria bacterium]|nr:MAG: leucyl aminopeptidase [Acidobacteriota bacterium]REK02349.1 MAG: leucyl aminopeptidase [Acidobacteriota bacterium]REK13849.1 MAG: leucyl aminopeptidase [Acidobacteriota bacterium]REK41844.1 MAG: leucyl aminopeptidase [Acidobacteriota bacterium]
MRRITFSLQRIVALTAVVLFAASVSLANTPFNISFVSGLPENGSVVLGIGDDLALDRFGKELNRVSNSGLSDVIKKMGFKGKKLTYEVIPAPAGSKFSRILLVGLGNTEALTALDWRKIGDLAVRSSVKHFGKAAPIAIDTNPRGTANIAFGASLGAYGFDKYFTDKARHKRQSELIVASYDANASATIFNAEHKSVAEGVWFTRDVSNEPSNVIYPETFVAFWKDRFEGLDNIKITVLDVDDMLEMNMGAIYGVGRGSVRPPRILVVEYNGGQAGDKPVALVGKGITFDSGGISLKNPDGMWDMKFDMSGAASVMGATYGIAGRGAKINVVAVAALAENMPDGNAQRPADVVRTMSGKTVSIRSTDAEGRLVLADAVYYTESKYEPAILVDLATLTGSAARALGDDYAAMFSRHEELFQGFIDAGKATGEEVWQLPLNENHFKAIKHDVADVMNSGPSAPGASAGAAFIGYFIKDTTKWVHFDIAGVDMTTSARTFQSSSGSRSFGVLLLNEYVKRNYE